jgi:hypothetical protein
VEYMARCGLMSDRAVGRLSEMGIAAPQQAAA